MSTKSAVLILHRVQHNPIQPDRCGEIWGKAKRRQTGFLACERQVVASGCRRAFTTHLQKPQSLTPPVSARWPSAALRSQAPHLLEGFCFPVRNEVAAVAALPDLSVGLSVGLIVQISVVVPLKRG